MAHQLSDTEKEGLNKRILNSYGNGFAPSMTKLPTDLKPPRGKVKKAGFEIIKPDLYKWRAKIVAFRIGPNADRERLIDWLQAFWLYYQTVYKERYPSDKIIWHHLPLDCLDSDEVKDVNYIFTETSLSVRNQNGTLKYLLSFNTITGSVWAHGNGYTQFESEDFGRLKYLADCCKQMRESIKLDKAMTGLKLENPKFDT